MSTELACVISQSIIKLLEKEKETYRIIDSTFLWTIYFLWVKRKNLFLRGNLILCLTCFPPMYTDKTESSLSILKIVGETIPLVSEVGFPNN